MNHENHETLKIAVAWAKRLQARNKQATGSVVVWHTKRKTNKMADNNNDEAAAEEDDRVTFVERLKSANPKEKLFRITFDKKFEDLPSEKGQFLCSSKFSCFENQWRVRMYPGGHPDSPDGMVGLYLERCTEGTQKLQLTMSLIICSILYADAMNCARLKESVMDFIMENRDKVIQRVSFHDVPGDVCKDLLVAMARHYESDSDDDDDDDDEMDVEKTYNKMRIRDLREKVHDKGLDIDGSREALIASLKEHSGS